MPEPPLPPDKLQADAALRLTRSAPVPAPPLPRSKGSKGSLHSLLTEVGGSPSSICSTSPRERSILSHALLADERRLSQSYSHANSHGLRAVEEERLKGKGSIMGRLERLDDHGEWHVCEGELAAGVFSVRAPTQSPGSEERRSFDTNSDASDGEEDDFVAHLDELSVAPGRRGRLVAKCALTRLRVVGTAPQHGEQGFRLVLDGARRHIYLRAQSYDDMCRWLLGFHRSLSAVVARLRRKPPGSPVLRGRAASADGGSPASESDVHKKSAHRPRRTPPVSPRRPSPPPLFTPPHDDGEPLYRKSSARTFRTGKYVPPHQRGDRVPPVLGDFEEIGEPVIAEWRSASSLQWRSAVSCERGPRRKNEDAYFEGETFFGVYDGHSGDEVARKCAAELHTCFEAARQSADAETALRTAFLSLDADYCAAAAKNEASPDAGATVLALVVEPASRRIVVANCGDCAAVLSRNGRAHALSQPHDPIPGSAEHRRVVEAGGWVTSETDLCIGRLRSMDLEDPEISRSAPDRVRLNEIHRVCGEVAVSRALGDVDFKGWPSEREPPCFAYPEGHPRKFRGDLLTAEPEVMVADLGPERSFVVLATDGVWDVLDIEEAVRVVDTLLKDGKTPQECCAKLVDRALRMGSGDNVTALVVEFAAAGPS